MKLTLRLAERLNSPSSSSKEAWEKCERGDLMLEVIQKQNVDLHLFTLAKVKIAKSVKHFMKHERSRKALLIAEKFARGEATQQELNDASDYSYDAAMEDADIYVNSYVNETSNSVAADASAVAHIAADIKHDAIDLPRYVANLSCCYSDSLKQSANICREIIPFELLNTK